MSTLKIQSTTKPEKPAKDINEWIDHLLKIGVRFNPDADYNTKQTKSLRLTSR